MLSTFAVYPCIFSCSNSSGSTLFAPFRGRGGSTSVSTTVAALEDAYTDADLFETVCQIRGEELDGAGTFELVHHIRGKASADELALGSFTRPNLKQLPIWDLRLASEWKQLDAHQKQEVFGVPCPAQPGATVLRSHWNYIIKPCGTPKARMCCDGSKRTAPKLRFAKRMPRVSISRACGCSLLCLLPGVS
jgi:hypothetical protein